MTRAVPRLPLTTQSRPLTGARQLLASLRTATWAAVLRSRTTLLPAAAAAFATTTVGTRSLGRRPSARTAALVPALARSPVLPGRLAGLPALTALTATLVTGAVVT